MATPFMAGAAALALSLLAKDDFRFFNRGTEVKELLKSFATTSPGLGAGGAVLWGTQFKQNGVVSWPAACAAAGDFAGAAGGGGSDGSGGSGGTILQVRAARRRRCLVCSLTGRSPHCGLQGECHCAERQQ